MKNLKKLVSVVLTLALLISSMATSVLAVDYADVETTDSNYEAIDILSGLGVLKGDDLGNFNPNADIKRSEVAAVLARTLGMEDAALGTTGYSAFADVAVDHWAVGYINWAAQQGIVNGRDAQTFDPEAPVKFQEVVKMLVEALGYGPLAAKRGGYPTGHMVIASSTAITSGVSLAGDVNAPRKIVAQLVYNALDVPLMDASVITLSGDDEYAIYNGKNDTERKTVLSEYLEIAKVKAQVISTSKGKLADATTIKLEKGDEEKVQLAITSLVSFDKVEDYADDYYDGNYDIDETPEAFCGGTDADTMLGYNVIAYIGADKEDENDHRIYAITLDTKSNKILEIKDWYNGIEEGDEDTATVISYYENGDDAEDAEEIEVAYNASVIVNGKYINTLDEVDADELLSEACDVTFMGGKTGAYNVVFVKVYEYAQVTAVDVENEVIETEQLGDLELFDEDIRYTITFEGKEISLADVAEDDVLNIVFNDYEDTSDLNNAEIIVSRDVVEGTVTRTSDEDGYYINDTWYTATEGFESNAGDEGKFYLTIDGKLLGHEVTSVSKDYAFIIDVAEDDGATFEDAIYIIQMMTADGVVAEYDVASKLTIYEGNDKVGTFKRDAQGTELADLIAATAAVEFDSEDEEDAADAKAAVEATIDDRFVSYKLNANGEISTLTFVGDVDDSVLNFGTLNGKYEPDFATVGNYAYDDATKLFTVEATDFDKTVDEVTTYYYAIGKDDVAIANIASLNEDKEDNYVGYAFNISGDDELAAAFVISNPESASGIKDALAVVKSSGIKGTNNAGDDNVDGYTILQAGEVKTIYESTEAAGVNVPEDGLKVGDVIYLTLDGNGDIDEYTVVYDASEEELLDADDAGYSFVYGIVKDATSSRIELVNEIDGASKKYLFDKNEVATYALIDTAKVRNGALTSAAVTALSSAGSVKETGSRDAYVAIVKVNEDGKVVDVVEVKYNDINEEANADYADDLEFNVPVSVEA